MATSVKSMTDPKFNKELLFVKMTVISVNYYGTFLVVRLEKSLSLMGPLTTCNIFQLFLYPSPCFIPSPLTAFWTSIDILYPVGSPYSVLLFSSRSTKTNSRPTKPLAVFIPEDALSVWTNYFPLCVVQDEQRKIIRPDG